MTVRSAPEKLDCANMDEPMDDLGSAQGLTTLNDKYKLATTKDEFQKRCTEMGEAIKMLKKYNRDCFSSLTQQVFKAILNSRQELNEKYCKPEHFDEALKASKCIVDNSLAQVQEAERKTILGSQVLVDANIADNKLRTRRACCAVLGSKNHFLNATKDKCSAYQSIYSDYVDSYTNEAFGLACPEQAKLECEKLEAIKTDGVEPKSKFFLNPMLKLVKTLDP